MVRADSAKYKEGAFTCQVVSQLDSTFTYEENEELVGNIIQLSCATEEKFTVEPKL